MEFQEYPLPSFYNPEAAGEVWRVPYQNRAEQAREWSRLNNIQPAFRDDFKLGLLLVDVQNTFCIPGFELFVSGQSGLGAVEDNRRLCSFIYKNLGSITAVTATLDTHDPHQIFHPVFFIDENGKHPDPHTQISSEDVENGRWSFNKDLAETLGFSPEYIQEYIRHYTQELERRGKYNLTIWPYHAIRSGIGHALVSAVEEAIFFHSICRQSRADFIYKGNNPLTEHYSVMGPEIMRDSNGQPIAEPDNTILNKLSILDALVIAGQAKSHCVSWTVNDLLERIMDTDPQLVTKVYLLEDCTSPVVVPNVVDYTQEAQLAFERFSKAGMHIVNTDVPLKKWFGKI
ncbi:MAG: isochorismatase [Anaerolineales bacterium]